jgi:hypothetical protein
MVSRLVGKVRCAAHIILFVSVLVVLNSQPVFGSNITLAWDAATDPTVAGYTVFYGSASRSYTNSVNAGAATSATLSGLVPGATYYIAATTYETNGLQSDYSAEVTVTIPAATGNQPPTLDALANLTINEDAGLQTVNLTGISSGATNQNQALTITAFSSAPSLISTPAVNYTSPNTTGTLTFSPLLHAFGTATITVMVDNGGASNNTVIRSFTVNVNFVNQAPTLDPLLDVTLSENAPLQTVNLSGITTGATNEFQTLTVTAVSSAPTVVPNPTVSYTSPNSTGTLTFTPAPYAFGVATITVNVNDGQTQNNYVTRSFAVTVTPVNQPPTLNALTNMTINWNAGPQTVSLSGITSGASNETQTLSVTAISSTPSLIANPVVNYTSPNSTGTLTFAPATNRYGSSTITVTVNDGQSTNNTFSRAFSVAVNQVIPPATLTNVTIFPNMTYRYPIPPINSDRLSYALGPYAPVGAKISNRGGVPAVVWTPTSDQASTTNVITVQITDNDVSSRSTNGTMVVVVGDLLSLSAGQTALRAGQSNSVPLYLTCSDGFTNLSFSMRWNSNRLVNPTFTPVAPGLGSSTIQNQGSNLVITLRTSGGQSISGTNLLGQLNFQASASQRSAFVWLAITNLAGLKPNGNAFVNPVYLPGEVAVVNVEPLLRATPGAGKVLTIYGRTGTNYQLQASANVFGPPAWSPVTTFTQTNLVQTMTVNPGGSIGFYRLLQQ